MISHVIFFITFLKLAEVFSRDGMSFLASCQNLVPRPWVIDDLETFKVKWSKKPWKKVSPIFRYMLQDIFFSIKRVMSLVAFIEKEPMLYVSLIL